MFQYISLGISLVSLVISVCVFFSGLYKESFRIDVSQKYSGDQGGFLKSYDGVYDSEIKKTGKPKMDHVLLIRIVISNKSSEPITIISFSLGEGYNSYDFASHSHTEPFYTITTETNVTTYFGFPDKPLDYLTPSFSLSPYEAVEGYLSFWVTDPKSFETGEVVKLFIHTSRGPKNFKVIIPPTYESHPLKYFDKLNMITYE